MFSCLQTAYQWLTNYEVNCAVKENFGGDFSLFSLHTLIFISVAFYLYIARYIQIYFFICSLKIRNYSIFINNFLTTFLNRLIVDYSSEIGLRDINLKYEKIIFRIQRNIVRSRLKWIRARVILLYCRSRLRSLGYSAKEEEKKEKRRCNGAMLSLSNSSERLFPTRAPLFIATLLASFFFTSVE